MVKVTSGSFRSGYQRCCPAKRARSAWQAFDARKSRPAEKNFESEKLATTGGFASSRAPLFNLHARPGEGLFHIENHNLCSSPGNVARLTGG
jgi:hypothetical protein